MYTWKHYVISIIKNNHFTIENKKKWNEIHKLSSFELLFELFYDIW